MASALIQSNAQSALISTLNSATAALINPFEYSVSKRIPSHGCQWIRLQPVNAGHTKKSDTLHFDLIHMGFTRSATLKLDVSLPATGDGGLALMGTRLGFLQLIDRIDISSSSRRILSMTQDAILAAMSDLPYEQRMAMEAGLYMGTNGNIGRQARKNVEADADQPIEVFLPLLFSVFDNCNLALATGFTEPIRVSVRFADQFDFIKVVNVTSTNAPGASFGAIDSDVTGTAVDAATVTGHANKVALNNSAVGGIRACDLTDAAQAKVGILKGELILEQRLLPNELEDATIAKNYGSGPLSQLVYDYESESVNIQNIDPNKRGVVLKHEIKSTAVITDMYVFVTYPRSDYLAASSDANSIRDGGNATSPEAFNPVTYADLDSPIELKNISLKASGQTIVDQIPCKYIGYFGKRTLKDQFFGASCGGTGLRPNFDYDARNSKSVSEHSRCCYVYRVQFGLDNVKQYDSGAVSLRELNAPTVEVELYKATKDSGTTDQTKDNNCEEAIAEFGKVTGATRPVQMHVVLRKLGLQTTDSSSGRVVSTLSN